MTIANRLDKDGTDSEEDFLKAGGVRVGEGRDKDQPWYLFPDGSAVWRCDNYKGPVFDWGWGCCLPE